MWEKCGIVDESIIYDTAEKKKISVKREKKTMDKKKIGMYKNNNNIKMEGGLDENLTMIILKLFFFRSPTYL